MSVISDLKRFILTGAKDESPELKEAILDLYVAIDTDLDDGYEPSTGVEEAVEAYNKVLIQLGEDEEKIQIEDAKIAESAKIGDLPKRMNEDDESTE